MAEDNIASDWQSQYLPEERIYTGSKDDGPGDVQVGYAPYDFESYFVALVHKLDVSGFRFGVRNLQTRHP